MSPTFHREDVEEKAGTIRLPEYEAQLNDALSKADNERLAELGDEYHQKRMELAEKRLQKEAGEQEDAEPEWPDRSWSRPDLDAFASERGVENPEELPNKQAVLEALEEVR